MAEEVIGKVEDELCTYFSDTFNYKVLDLAKNVTNNKMFFYLFYCSIRKMPVNTSMVSENIGVSLSHARSLIGVFKNPDINKIGYFLSEFKRRPRKQTLYKVIFRPDQFLQIIRKDFDIASCFKNISGIDFKDYLGVEI